MYSHSLLMKQQVEDAVTATGTLSGSGKGLDPYFGQSERFGRFEMSASERGVVRGVSEQFSLWMVLTPSLAGTAVVWDCEFRPPQFGPVECRD